MRPITAVPGHLLQFDHATRTSAANGAFKVCWSGGLIATVDQTGTTMVTTSLSLTAIEGDNILRFVGTGSEDNTGGSLDNVRLYAVVVQGYGAGNDLLVCGRGDDTTDGGAGDDIAKFSGASTDYLVTADGNGDYAVEDLTADRMGSTASPVSSFCACLMGTLLPMLLPGRPRGAFRRC